MKYEREKQDIDWLKFIYLLFVHCEIHEWLRFEQIDWKQYKKKIE